MYPSKPKKTYITQNYVFQNHAQEINLYNYSRLVTFLEYKYTLALQISPFFIPTLMLQLSRIVTNSIKCCLTNPGIPWGSRVMCFNVLSYGCDKTAANSFVTVTLYLFLTAFTLRVGGDGGVFNLDNWKDIYTFVCSWSSNVSGLTIVTSKVLSAVQCRYIVRPNFGISALIRI